MTPQETGPLVHRTRRRGAGFRSVSSASIGALLVTCSCAAPTQRFWDRWGADLTGAVEEAISPALRAIGRDPLTVAEVRALALLAADPQSGVLARFRHQQKGTRLERLAVVVAGTAVIQLALGGLLAEAERLARRSLELARGRSALERAEANFNSAIAQLMNGRRRDAVRSIAAGCLAVRRTGSLPLLLRCYNWVTTVELRHGRPKSAALLVEKMCGLCARAPRVPRELAGICRLRCLISRLDLFQAARPEAVPRLVPQLMRVITEVGSGLGPYVADRLPGACRRLADLGAVDEALACLDQLRQGLSPAFGSPLDLSLRLARATLLVDDHRATEGARLLDGLEGVGVDLLLVRVALANGRHAEAALRLARVERGQTLVGPSRVQVFEGVQMSTAIRENAARASFGAHAAALRGRLAEAGGRDGEARAFYEQAFALLDAARMFFVDLRDPGRVAESDSEVLVAARRALVRLAVRRYIQAPSPRLAREAWVIAERRRAQQLRSRWLDHPALDGSRFLAPPAVADDNARVGRIRSLRALRARAEQRSDSAAIVRIGDDLKREQGEEAWWLHRLRVSRDARERTYAELRAPEPSIEQLPLEPGEVLVQFHADDDALYRFILRERQGVRVDRIDIARKALASRIDRLLRPLRAGDVSRFDVRAAHRLYNLLFGGADEAFAGTARWLVVPDGPLWAIPFELLVASPSANDGSAGQRFLGLERTLLYLPAASTLGALRAPREQLGKGKLLAVGDVVYGPGDDRCRGVLARECLRRFGRAAADVPQTRAAYRGIRLRPTSPHATSPAPEPVAPPPTPGDARPFERLPATAGEVAALVSLAPNEVRVFAGLGATEADVLRAMVDPGVGVMHFATHAILGREIPGVREPALVMAGEPRSSANDGFLTAREIAGLDLRAETVVLSACHTGAGATLRGEGAQSLGYAFLLAGAREVVASLWPVDDRATADLMKVFHRERAHGAGEALRRARVEIARGERTHPFFWAAFVAMGAR